MSIIKELPLYLTKNINFAFDIKVDSLANPAQPFNLTGYSATMTIAKFYESNPKYNVPTAIPEPLTGIIKLSLPAAITGTIPAGSMVYSIIAVHPTNPPVVIRGPITIQPTVS